MVFNLSVWLLNPKRYIICMYMYDRQTLNNYALLSTTIYSKLVLIVILRIQIQIRVLKHLITNHMAYDMLVVSCGLASRFNDAHTILSKFKYR